MDGALRTAVEQLIAERTSGAARITGSSPATGGCIHRGEIVELADGRRFFVKFNPAPPPQIFEREALGLAALYAVGTIRLPRPLGTGGEPVAFLVMEAIQPGSQPAGFFADFGRRFACLHRFSSPPPGNSVRRDAAARREERYGFDHDNHIGATPQPNPWTDDWVDFFRDHRLDHQLALARANRVSDRTLDRLGDRLLDRLDELIGEPDEPPCLLHGDLWSGNYMVGDAGEPVLIDPAAYYGRREADLAMTHLFGGFDARFYAAYEEIWPLAPGSGDRLEVYKLYHLLNHLNLFGGGYRQSCVSIMRRFAG